MFVSLKVAILERRAEDLPCSRTRTVEIDR